MALFKNDAIKGAFSDYLAKAKRRLGFHLYAWVLMSEHFHLLLRPASSSQDVSQVLRGIKAGFAKATIRRWRELDAPILPRIQDSEGRARLWQTGGGYDRNLYSEREVLEKIAYIHANPVRRGLAKESGDWRWSSVLWYEKREVYSGPDIDSL